MGRRVQYTYIDIYVYWNRCSLRRRRVGKIPNFFYMFPVTSVVENFFLTSDHRRYKFQTKCKFELYF